MTSAATPSRAKRFLAHQKRISRPGRQSFEPIILRFQAVESALALQQTIHASTTRIAITEPNAKPTYWDDLLAAILLSNSAFPAASFSASSRDSSEPHSMQRSMYSRTVILEL